MPACCEGTVICGVNAEIEIIECSDHTSNGREGGQGYHGHRDGIAVSIANTNTHCLSSLTC